MRGWRVRPEFLPPPFVLPWFAMAAAFTAVRLVLPSPPARVAKFSEVAELTVALAAAITVLQAGPGRLPTAGGRRA